MKRHVHADLASMFAQLSLSRRANLPDDRALAALVQDEEAKSLNNPIVVFAEMLRLRPAIGDAMAEMPQLFHSETVELLRVAERDGNAAAAFELLADDYDWLDRRRRETSGALAYPALLLAMLTVLLLLMSVFVLPAFAEVYKSFGGDLPRITLAVFVVAPWIGGTLALLILIFLVAALTSTSWLLPVRRWLLRRLLRWAATRRYLQKAAEARLTRALMHAASGGLAWVEVLRHLGATSASATEALLFLDLASRLRGGSSLGDALTQVTGLPRRLAALVSLAQGSPMFSEMLRNLADLSATQTQDTHESLRRRSIAGVYSAVVILVGISIIALYMPIFRLGALF